MKKIINKIYKFLIKLLCLFIPSKKLRRKIRNSTYRNNITIKKLKKLYPDSIFLWLPLGGIGEFTQIISLMKAFKEKINKNIVLITNKKLERDVVSLIDENIAKCYYGDNIFVKDIKNLDKLDNLNSDNIYGFKGMLIPNKKDKKYFFHESVKQFFNLPKETKKDTIIPTRPENNNQDFLDIEKIFKNEKVIFIFPEANTYDYTIITKEVWTDIATRLTNDGYTCIFNSKEKYGDFINVFFDIKETLYLATLANSIITFRSGMSELLAISTNCNMIVVYPNGKEYFFIKESLKLFGTSDDYRKFLASGQHPYILDENKDLIKSFFEFDSIQHHFNKKNCENYIYDFDNEDFYNFIINKL